MKICLIGAGGKMGCRITRNVKDMPGYEMRYVENSPEGIARLRDIGVETSPLAESVRDADVVVLAIPDRLVGRLGREIVPLVPAGSMVISLDPAAACAGVLPERGDIAYFVSHPCHPPLFNDETDPRARTDWFGGQALAKQDIVCALHQGTDAEYARGAELAKAMFAPVVRAHRVTVEQMAMLEPALVETFTSTLVASMKEAMEHAIAQGVPRAAAESFIMGHLRIQFAVIFGYADFPFSDGAYLAMSKARDAIFRPDWLENVMDRDNILRSVREITDSLDAGKA